MQEKDEFGHIVGRDWTTSEIAEAVGLSTSRIKQLTFDGTIKSTLFSNTLRLIKYEDALEFIEKRMK